MIFEKEVLFKECDDNESMDDSLKQGSSFKGATRKNSAVKSSKRATD